MWLTGYRFCLPIVEFYIAQHCKGYTATFTAFTSGGRPMVALDPLFLSRHPSGVYCVTQWAKYKIR